MLVRVRCSCGQELEVDTTLAAPAIACPHCGCTHTVPSVQDASAVVDNEPAPADQLADTEPPDRTWILVAGAILAGLLVCLVLLRALLADFPGGQTTGGSHTEEAGTGIEIVGGSVGDGSGQGEYGDATGSSRSGDGTGLDATVEHVGSDPSDEDTVASERDEEPSTPPLPPAPPSEPAERDQSPRQSAQGNKKPTGDPSVGFADQSTPTASQATDKSKSFDLAKWGRPEASGQPGSSPNQPKPGRSGRSGRPGKGTDKKGLGIFDNAGTGRKVVYVIDYSSSMTGERLQAAKDELIRSLRKLRKNKRFYVIFYDDYEDPIPEPNLLVATKNNVQDAITWIGGATGGGGTDPTDALIHAIRLKPDTIWLLSDGCFSDSVCDVIRKTNSGRKVSINTIAFHERMGEPVLKRIAKENKGDYRFVPDPAAPRVDVRSRRRRRR